MTDRTEPSGKRRNFFGELKRRNVLRAGALYIAAVWALSQGIAQLAPVFHAPDWLARWFVFACVIGFPFWLGFAWLFEITPSGLKLEHQVDKRESIAHLTGRKLDFWIIGTLAVAVVLLATNQFVLHRDATSIANAERNKAIAAAFAAIPAKSVAVLPLSNNSSDPAQQYFADGLSEELISDLTQIDGLKVIGRFSSFKFRDSRDTPAEIGVALGVAHLIQGSVRQQGDRIRVNISMIRARDGSSIWAHSYDDRLEDVFKIQSKIGHAVASALRIKLLGDPVVAGDKPPGGNVQAYMLTLQGHALVQEQTRSGFAQGIALLRQALALDPQYAYAWGILSTALINQGQMILTGDARKQAFTQARVAAGKQQVLAPDTATTHMDQGYLLMNLDKDPTAALAEYRQAVKLAPNDGRAMAFLAYGLVSMGQLKQATELFDKAIATDPLRVGWLAALASVQVADGRLDAAEETSRRVLALKPGFPGMHTILAQISILRGKFATAVRDAAREPDPAYGAWIRAMAQQINPDRRQADQALQAYIAGHGDDQPYFVADMYALRKQPDRMFEWLQRARREHDPALLSLLYDPFPLAYRHDPRFAALCRQAGLPVPGRSPSSGANVSSRH